MPSEINDAEVTFLTKTKAAEWLGISVRTLSRLHAAGIGPARIKCRGIIKYRLSELHKWLIAHEQTGVRSL